MSPERSHSFDPRKYAQEVLNNSQEVLKRAVAVIAPENPEADPLQVFPAPHELRAEDPGISLSEDQQLALRSAAAELGFGREATTTVSELGLHGAAVILEGGQAHKMLAEGMVLAEDAEAQPAFIFIAASPNRKIADKEREVTAGVLGIEVDEVGESEYDVAKQVAACIPGFEAHSEHHWPFGYDIDNNFEVSVSRNRQLTALGQIDEKQVILLRIDRENYVDDNGENKYRKQPDTATTIGIVSQVLELVGHDTTPIAFITSGTYEASRKVSGAKAALQTNHVVGVPTYGTALLARVKGEETPAPGPINQLPGELHKMALDIQKLDELLRETEPK